MQYDFEIYIEGKSFTELGLKPMVTSLSITHQTPKAKTHRAKSKKSRRTRSDGSSGQAPHEAEVKFANPKESLSEYFHELDKFSVWLGYRDEMFFQGEYILDKLTKSASSTEHHSIELSLVCKAFMATRKHTNRVYIDMSPKDILKDLCGQFGWLTQFEDTVGEGYTSDVSASILDEKISVAVPSTESHWSAIANVAEASGLTNIYMVYPSKVRPNVSPQSTIAFKSVKFDEAVGPDGKPLILRFGPYRGDNSIVISKYSKKSDIKQATGAKNGGVGATGKPGGSQSTGSGGAAVQVPGVDPKNSGVWPPAQVHTEPVKLEDSENPEVKVTASRNPLSKNSQSLANSKLANEVADSNKAVLELDLVQPVPFLYTGFEIYIENIKGEEGSWEVSKVKHEMGGSKTLASSVSVTRIKPEVGGNSSKAQGAHEGEDSGASGGAAVQVPAVFSSNAGVWPPRLVHSDKYIVPLSE